VLQEITALAVSIDAGTGIMARQKILMGENGN